MVHKYSSTASSARLCRPFPRSRSRTGTGTCEEDARRLDFPPPAPTTANGAGEKGRKKYESTVARSEVGRLVVPSPVSHGTIANLGHSISKN